MAAKHDMSLASLRVLVTRLAKRSQRNLKVAGVPRWLVKAMAIVMPLMRELDEMLYQWEAPVIVDDRRFRARFHQVPEDVDEAAHGNRHAQPQHEGLRVQPGRDLPPLALQAAVHHHVELQVVVDEDRAADDDGQRDRGQQDQDQPQPLRGIGVAARPRRRRRCRPRAPARAGSRGCSPGAGPTPCAPDGRCR